MLRFMKNNININEKSDEELILILETPEDYQEFLIKMAEKELGARNIGKHKIAKIAGALYRKKSEDLLNKISDYDQELELPTSNILPKDKKVAIFKDVLREVTKRREIFKGNAGGYIA